MENLTFKFVSKAIKIKKYIAKFTAVQAIARYLFPPSRQKQEFLFLNLF